MPRSSRCPGRFFARPNDVGSLGAGVDDDTGLVLLEPVLGEGGVIPLAPEFIQAAAEMAAQAGAFLCLDEIQTGVGRTGTFFAFEQSGVRPDLVTLAKGLANGLPLGCLLVAEEAAGAFEPGDHASTFGGNPVACAAACAVCDAVDDDLLSRVRDVGPSCAPVSPASPPFRMCAASGSSSAPRLDRPAARSSPNASSTGCS